MLPASSLSAKDQLRRSKSTRSIRRNRRSSFTSEPFDPELARVQATAAASQAMRRSNERSSMESKRSYDRLGGPECLAVPSRRRQIQNPTVGEGGGEDGSSLSAACYIQNQDTYPVSLGTINEFGGLDGRISSLPSSYRRLRKAKSMFSTRQPTVSRLRQGISSEAFGCGPRTPQEVSTGTTPRSQRSLRRSMSFLRGGGVQQPSRALRHAQSQDASIQLARSQFSQSRKPSLTYLKPRREHKPFRKTFRSVSGPVTDDTGTPHSEKSRNSARIHGKARTFSLTIKKGLKRVLGITKSPEEHVTASDLPADLAQWDNFQSSTVGNQEYTAGSDFDSPLQEYSPARPPTMRSSRSNDSLATSHSRVTSWADSTAVPTISNRKTVDRNPLSIINENEVQTPGGRSRQGSPRPNMSVDGQRLYSALMRHIGGNETDEGGENVSLGFVKEHHPIPERASSLHTCRSRRTIRHIPSDDSMASPLSFATASGSRVSPARQRPRQSNRHDSHSKSPQSAAYCRFDDSSSMRRQLTGSLFAIGEDSDDDSSSVIVDRSKNEKQDDSPSVYSRTASSDAGNAASPNPTEEPGMAMIYESQRSVYSSPKRSGNSSSAGAGTATPTRSSADWQKWMKAEMERIESNERRGHYREKARIDDNDDDVNTIHSLALSPHEKTVGQVSLAPSEAGNSSTPVQSNFSRPFSRSSSIRSMAAPQRSHADNESIAGGLSLSAWASNRLPQPPESPTPKREPRDSPSRRMTGQFRRYPTSRMPLSLQGKPAPFQPMRPTPWDHRHVTDENVKEGRSETSSPYQRQHSYSPVSSRQMVDDFLDSRRRRRMEEDNSSGAFV